MTQFGSYFETLYKFGFSSRSLGHVMFSFAGTAQEAGAGGRSGAAGNPVRGSLMVLFLYVYRFLHFSILSSETNERKHHVTKTSC